ncbi:hypothetical protein ABFS82_05G044500 [Erythranthe guttata]
MNANKNSQTPPPATTAEPIPPHNNYQAVQPPPVQPAHGGGVLPGFWSTGLCGCYSDVSNYCITCWCPCITFGQIAEIVDKGSISCLVAGGVYALIRHSTGCPCFYSCFYRSKLRKQYMIDGNNCTDCMVHCCCEPCALRQEYRELKYRGFDMSLSLKEIVEGKNQGVRKAPFVEGGMSR